MQYLNVFYVPAIVVEIKYNGIVDKQAAKVKNAAKPKE